MVVTVEQSRLLNKAVADLVAQAEAEEAYLTDFDGNVLAQASPHDSRSVQGIAALSAGAFSATRQLAGLMGEAMFQSVYHQGHNTHLYMQSLASQFLILVVFARQTTVGLVKLYVRKLSEELDPLLRELAGQTAAGVGADREAFALDPAGRLFEQRPASPPAAPERRAPP